MFTGLVEGLGTIRAVRSRSGVREITVASDFPPEDLRSGASVAVHGVCLTLIEDGRPDGTFRVQASPETIRRTSLRDLRAGDRVHLERPLRAGDRLGGHMVQGHVDGVGRLARVGRLRGERVLEIALHRRWIRYLVERGSVGVDGVSLTVGRVGEDAFRVHVIPATLRATLLGEYRPGRRVNVEVDVLAKYVESLVRPEIRGEQGEGEE